MLALILTRREAIVIDTPEGDVRIRLCPPPRFFNVDTRPRHSLHTEPASESELDQHGGAKNWVVLESAAGRVRIRRFSGRHVPQTMCPEPAPGQTPTCVQDAPRDDGSAEADSRPLRRCHLIIDAPRWMHIWREPIQPPDGPTGPGEC